jgi:cytochrome o ubiquinol oxidase subunit IV
MTVTSNANDGGRGQQGEYRRELLSYVCGFGLALALTLVPYGLVYWSAMQQSALYLAIGACALVQGVVHFRFFLHINPPRQNMDDLQLVLFSGLLLFMMIGGTIWILANLAMRMG